MYKSAQGRVVGAGTVLKRGRSPNSGRVKEKVVICASELGITKGGREESIRGITNAREARALAQEKDEKSVESVWCVERCKWR